MSDTENIIREENKQLVVGFNDYLKKCGLSTKTVKSQSLALDFFTEYLVYYEPYKKLSETDISDVRGFLNDFFPRKALWANETSVKEYITVFKKCFKWLISTKIMAEDEYQMLLDEIKESKEEWLNLVT